MMNPFYSILITVVTIATVMSGCGGDSILRQKDPDYTSLIIESETKYRSPRWDVRLKGIEESATCLHSYEHGRTVALLYRATHDSHPLVQINALKYLSSIRNKNIRDRVAAMAASADDEKVRMQAIETLGMYRSEVYADIFERAYGTGSSWLEREYAIKGLLMIQNKDVVRSKSSVINRALQDENISVRIAALDHLDVHDAVFYSAVTGNMLKAEEDSQISLLKSSLRAMEGFLLKEEERKKIVSLLTHSNKDVRVLALRVLKRDHFLRQYAETETARN